MKIALRHILIGLGAAIALALAVFWLGLINIGASSGHWPITDWLLHTAMQRSVGFYAGNEPPENYPSAAMVRRGAGHYETGCAFCHGSPLRPRSPVVREMTPVPPALEGRVEEWEPRELFQIVMHGVKFTGMPAWPARNRDDEVWSLVAFLEQLPSLDRDEYRQLAFGSAAPSATMQADIPDAAQAPLKDCVRCHGADGLGAPNGAFPRLDIQNTAYLRSALGAYAGYHRFSGIMQTATAVLSADELDALAEYYGNRPVAPVAALSPSETDPALLRRGETIASHGIPEDNVGACSGCHDANGNAARAEFPVLAGQYRNYLETQLELFASEAGRGGGPYLQLMEQASHTLSAEDIEAVSAWYATQIPGEADAGGTPSESSR